MRALSYAMVLIGVIGFFAGLLVAGRYESEATLVQWVSGGTRLIDKPIRVILPPGAKRIKGTGPKESAFYAIESVKKEDVVPLDSYMAVVSLARISSIGLIVMGCLAVAIDRWYRKTMRILAGENPEL